MQSETKSRILLTIAGFDPSNGAGITADLQTFAAHGYFGISAITALTVQSTKGVSAVEPVDSEILARTLAELQSDLPASGIKIGMLGSADIVTVVTEFLESLPGRPTVVLDPVLRSSSGAGLLDADGLEKLQTALLPLVDWVTPNWAELAALSGVEVRNETEALRAMEAIVGRCPNLGVIVTGGDQDEPVDLVRQATGSVERIVGQHIQTTSTHGTGCAFSSALLCELIAGTTSIEAAKLAKQYVEGALRHAPGLGAGRGPMNLFWQGSVPYEHLR